VAIDAYSTQTSEICGCAQTTTTSAASFRKAEPFAFASESCVIVSRSRTTTNSQGGLLGWRAKRGLDQQVELLLLDGLVAERADASS
jgi:hypothetical protein